MALASLETSTVYSLRELFYSAHEKAEGQVTIGKWVEGSDGVLLGLVWAPRLEMLYWSLVFHLCRQEPRVCSHIVWRQWQRTAHAVKEPRQTDGARGTPTGSGLRVGERHLGELAAAAEADLESAARR